MELAPKFAGPRFDSPFLERELEESDLDDRRRDQVRQFASDGFIVIDDLGFDDFDALAERIVDDTAPLYAGSERVQDAWLVSDAVRTLALAPTLLELLETLYGRPSVPFQTLNFEYGTQQASHSDTLHFHCLPKNLMCGVWVALEDVDERNGPLHYYPGSHRLPDYDGLDLGLPPIGNGDETAAYAAYERFIADMLEASGLERKQLLVKKGQALVWAANLYHGGDRIAEPGRTRLSQVTHHYFDGCVYYTPMRSDIAHGKLAYRRVRNIRTGEYEPLLYDGKRVRAGVWNRARWAASPIMRRRRLQRRAGHS